MKNDSFFLSTNHAMLAEYLQIQELFITKLQLAQQEFDNSYKELCKKHHVPTLDVVHSLKQKTP